MLYTPTISNGEPAQKAPASEAVGSGRLGAPLVERAPQALQVTLEPSRNFRLPACNLNMNFTRSPISSVLVPVADVFTMQPAFKPRRALKRVHAGNVIVS